MTSMRMRGDVALGGNFGYELDLSSLGEDDLAEIRRQIAQVKEIRRTTQQGVFTRLLSPFEGNVTAWQFADDTRVILCAYRVLCQPNAKPIRVRLAGLKEGMYKSPDGTLVSSDALMHVGVRPPFERGDFSSSVMIFERV